MASIECDDCGVAFPLREAAGVCQKCEKLKPHAHDSKEYDDISAWRQCTLCGVTRRNNMPIPDLGDPQTCGSEMCVKKLQESAGPGLQLSAAQANIAESYLLRAAATAKRFHTGPTMTKGPVAGTSLNTAALLHHEHGGGTAGEDKVAICWAARESKTPKSVSVELGTSAKKWAVSCAMPDIKASVTEVINVEWVRKRAHPLLPEEISFRWHGNRLLETNTANMTLAQFYAFYSTPSRAGIYLANIPTTWKSLSKSIRGPIIYLELYIDNDAYNQRVSCHIDGSDSEDDEPTAGRRKRVLSSTSANGGSSKRLNSSFAPMRSMFCPTASSSISDIHRSSPVTLTKLVCVVDPTSGVAEFEDRATLITGSIRDTHFGSGAMKQAYHFKTDTGDALVVKRFYRLTEPDPNDTIADLAVPPSVLENQCEIYREAQRLAIGAHLLKAFKIHAKQVGATICQGLSFAEAWIGEEVRQPSVASGTPVINGPPGQNLKGISWLVETKRATTVEHYTFTLNHQITRKDLCALTVDAFSHFSYGHSNKTTVLADIQGTPAHLNGKDVTILFDPMTHTIAGNSGIGDFGIEGIKSFFRDHECGEVCISMGLDRSVPLKEEDLVPASPSSNSAAEA